jgi:hypothetical protein
MQPLGLTNADLDRYHAFLLDSHDFRIEVDVLNTEDKVLTSLEPEMVDGQVNIQRDGLIRRTATLNLFDPGHNLHFDSGSPFDGALYADRMIRVRHIVDVPDVGVVTAIPFVGPVVKLGRNGDELTIECQDKGLFGVEGCRPKTIRKGVRVVDAIETIMRQCTGERRFRFPKGVRARLTKPAKVGWAAEAAPLLVCKKLAASIGFDLFYSCDGYLTMRRNPKAEVFIFKEGAALTSRVAADHDFTGVRNWVRATGHVTTKKKIKGKPDKQVKHTYTATAVAGSRHPLRPGALGRHGVPRYLPLLIDDSNIRSNAIARQRARSELDKALPMSAAIDFDSVPIFHLDCGDKVRVETDGGSVTVPYDEGSIPLGLGGDASVGAQRRISRPRRRK